ncbi:unnamed protein product [Calypogeia fissa]
MVVGMGAGLQTRACCPCNCSCPSTSSAAPSSSSSSTCSPFSLAVPALPLRQNNIQLRLTSSLFSGSETLNRLKKCSGSAAAAAVRFAPAASLSRNRRERIPRSVQLQVLPHSSLAERSSELGDGQVESVDEEADIDSITEWEMDFCSRPILDPRGKKIWELVVCDNQRQLQFARFYPNNVINSGTLRDALMYIIQTLGVPKPRKVRFFRSQMQTIIGKACSELDIQPVPSQRCIALVRWLDERFETVYSKHPGYQEGAGPLTLLEQPLPVDVPDTLRGEQWAFVQLPFSALLEEIAAVKRGDNFGSIFDLGTLGLDLPPDAMIPGVAVASERAVPLAAWTNALELSSIDAEMKRSCLILSSGVSDRWRYAFWRKGEQGDQEAQAWEKAKRRVGGLHFLAVQQSLDSELCAGFWLLMNPPKSPV